MVEQPLVRHTVPASNSITAPLPRTAINSARRTALVSRRPYLDAAVVERGAAADVGEALAGQLVDIGAAHAELAPPHAQAVDDTRPRTFAYARAAVVAAALVEHLDHRAVDDATRGGILRMHLEQRLPLGRTQARHVDEARIEEVARRRRDHRQRVACRLR